MTQPLTFAALRAANIARLPLFKNRRGGPAHSEPDGSDWSLGEWCNAVLGELGEAANLIKKVKRGDVPLAAVRAELAKEYADVVTYLDILAFRSGIDLGEATAAKWDEVSERVGVPLRIADFDTQLALRREAREAHRCINCGKFWGEHFDGDFCDRSHGHEEAGRRVFTLSERAE